MPVSFPVFILKRCLRLVPLVMLLTLVWSFTTTRIAHAAEVDIPCEVEALVDAVGAANSNSEPDTLNLAAGCYYSLSSSLFVEADNGNPLIINGNDATISGDGMVSAFEICCGDLTVNNLRIENTYEGGIFLSGGSLTLNNSTVTGNYGEEYGAISNMTGVVTLNNSTIAGNNGVLGGGILNVGGTLTVNGSSITSNYAMLGAGILDFAGFVTVNGSRISSNFGTVGGGLLSISGSIEVNNSSFDGNQAAIGAGLLSVNLLDIIEMEPEAVSRATGLMAEYPLPRSAMPGTLTVNSTSFTHNTSEAGSAIVFAEGNMTLTNSTISGNTGPAVAIISGTVELVNSTIANNTSVEGAGLAVLDASVTVTNTIIANNVGGDCMSTGMVVPAGNNLVGDGSCGFAAGGDARLGALTGSPAYHPLQAGSPALDAADNALCPATDQRGVARPFDGDYDGIAICDIGAYEANQPLPTPVPTTPTPVPTAPPPPPTPLCEDHNFAEGGVVRASTVDGIDYAVNCRVLYQNGRPTQWLGGDLYDSGAIGNPGILELGVIQAVDIFSPVGMTYFNGGAVFCLRGSGTLIWLAASGIPRHAEIVGSYSVPEFPGFTCITLFEPGTLVLVRENPIR